MEKQNQQPNQQLNQTFIDEQKRQKSKRIKIALLALAAVVFVGGIVIYLGAYSDLFDTRGKLREKVQRSFPIQPKEQACIIDADCVIVNDCSGCSCGAAINKTYKQEYEERYVGICENYRGHVCEFYCETPHVRCISNRCVLSAESAFTDTSIWQTYRNDEFGFEVKYPSHWKFFDASLEGGYDSKGYSGEDGFFRFQAVEEVERIDELAKYVAYFDSPYGSMPVIESLKIEGQEARLILPSDDQTKDMKKQSALVMVYLQPVVIQGNEYHYLVLFADVDHIRQILSTFRFVQEGDVEGTRKVKLFYYNRNYDPKGDCLSEAVLPVEREIPYTKTPIRDTITLLIEGKLTEKEVASGFSTEFPHPEFKLLGINLKDGLLILDFPEIFSFTTGGSCRVGLLRAQIEKTAKQFSEVREIKYTKEGIFQP